MQLRTYHRPHSSLYKSHTRVPGFLFGFLTFEDGTDRLSQNVCKWLPYLLRNNPEDHSFWSWLCFNTILLFFHIVTRLVQALVIVYSEFFQALVVEGTPTFRAISGPWLFDSVVMWKLLMSAVFSVSNTWQSKVVRSQLWVRWGTKSLYQMSGRAVVAWSVCGLALSCSSSTPQVRRPNLWHQITSLILWHQN